VKDDLSPGRNRPAAGGSYGAVKNERDQPDEHGELGRQNLIPEADQFGTQLGPKLLQVCADFSPEAVELRLQGAD
jgi:hypothetical protein